MMKHAFNLMVFGTLLLGTTTMGEAAAYALKGKVMDTDDNWLNDAKVTLREK